MNRRSFLSSLPFLLPAIRAVTAAITVERPAEIESAPEPFPEHFAVYQSEMVRILCEHIARTDPYTQLLQP